MPAAIWRDNHRTKRNQITIQIDAENPPRLSRYSDEARRTPCEDDGLRTTLARARRERHASVSGALDHRDRSLADGTVGPTARAHADLTTGRGMPVNLPIYPSSLASKG